MGPLMLDVSGLELDAEDRDRLQHPQCGGLILFSRNYESVDQITRLVRDARKSAGHPILVAVDQEGGRVQRFREGFFALPPQRSLGALYDQSAQEGIRMANQLGWMMASEIRATGIDFSFAPVLDLDYQTSTVIGDRALHSTPDVVTALGRAYTWGMKRAGMPSVAKHFPGHGYATADSHLEVAVDERPMEDIEAMDLRPFSELIGLGLEAVMPAHVVYSACDHRPAGFSPFWIQDVLRTQLGFQGAVVSDDLNMQAAAPFGSPFERAIAALDAGCNLLLMCNNSAAADEILEGLEADGRSSDKSTLSLLKGRKEHDWQDLHRGDAWRQAEASVQHWLA